MISMLVLVYICSLGGKVQTDKVTDRKHELDGSVRGGQAQT
jgi:hypothetical protein